MKKWLIGIGIFILVIAVGAFAGYQYVMNQVQGSAAQKEFEMAIEPGESLKQVLSKLEDNGLVGNAQWRYLYMRLKQPDYTYQAGEYRIEKGTSLKQALEKFKYGDVADNTLKVTIPEGWNIKQIASRLAEEKLGKKETYLQLLADPAFYKEMRQKYAFLPPLQDKVKFPFEGYLYPETYQFAYDATEKEIIDDMLSQTQSVIDELANQHPEIKENTHDVFTLASVIEKETTVLEERPRVAGVFVNRLNKDMRLESDATVQYVLGKQKDRILYEDLEVKDPYNTYRNKGLPPGPIAAPGLTSLQAALDPEENDYLYFVTKKDGSRSHYFAETFAEHRENRAKSEAHRDEG